MKGRDKFAVTTLVILHVCIWTSSILRNFGIHYWNKQHALQVVHEAANDGVVGDSTYLIQVSESYLTKRYVYFLPHVTCAIIWWNLYFLQLIPKVRHAFKKALHRRLGRVLMVSVFIQIITGAGLALTSDSKVITMISVWFAVAVTYCLYYAWKFAIQRDIPRHKFWVLRMVGYLQGISFQRFWLIVIISSYELGWRGLYPTMEAGSTVEACNAVVKDMFDHSFILSILTSVYLTEWYLSEEFGMTLSSKDDAEPIEAHEPLGDELHNEESRLIVN
ncbi:hypothetical protein CTEN210_13464 [Chaetoceros tenuissimus]|uniref:Uncharacterized protein n=1 Tax=Chaetoceros tenuissimus TaxID=426638 RepID=A0AAD3HBG4_9STRA|nr:hypothetical protein CTEN210_13464 [Chaetoceros tenuissimus]